MLNIQKKHIVYIKQSTSTNTEACLNHPVLVKYEHVLLHDIDLFVKFDSHFSQKNVYSIC
jgi:hypothetical protein